MLGYPVLQWAEGHPVPQWQDGRQEVSGYPVLQWLEGEAVMGIEWMNPLLIVDIEEESLEQW